MKTIIKKSETKKQKTDRQYRKLIKPKADSLK